MPQCTFYTWKPITNNHTHLCFYTCPWVQVVVVTGEYKAHRGNVLYMLRDVKRWKRCATEKTTTMLHGCIKERGWGAVVLLVGQDPYPLLASTSATFLIRVLESVGPVLYLFVEFQNKLSALTNPNWQCYELFIKPVDLHFPGVLSSTAPSPWA